jgi:hypothetical protein
MRLPIRSYHSGQVAPLVTNIATNWELSMARGMRLRTTVRLVSGGTTIVLAGVLLAGCGSSNSSAASGPSAASTAPSATSSATAPASFPTAAAVKLGHSDSSFCEKARAEESESDSDVTAFASDSPADLEKAETKALAQLPAFVDAAPAQIKGAAKTLAAADQTLFAALKAANFDFTKINPSSIAAVETPAFTQASEQIATYLSSTCGIDISATPSG